MALSILPAREWRSVQERFVGLTGIFVDVRRPRPIPEIPAVALRS
jgi:hypothetical protein